MLSVFQMLNTGPKIRTAPTHPNSVARHGRKLAIVAYLEANGETTTGALKVALKYERSKNLSEDLSILVNERSIVKVAHGKYNISIDYVPVGGVPNATGT